MNLSAAPPVDGPEAIVFSVLRNYHNTTMGRTCQLQVRRLAGFMTLLGLGLGVFVSQWFLLLIGFVGLNLIQSSFTDTCPAEELLPGCDTGASAS